jgi:hypothetical protein
VRLAIADPPYPPLLSTRSDLAGGAQRVTSRSRARRWYGDGPRAWNDSPPADFHADAGRWDDPAEHRALLESLAAGFDGWAIATSPDGLDAYRPLPIGARTLAWVVPNRIPGGSRVISRWEAVVAFVPEERRGRAGAHRVDDVLVEPAPAIRFPGAKPPAWTRWVLAVLGYDPAVDEVVDLFPGSGSVSAAADGMLL